MAKKKLVIIDGNALIHRAFHALPPTLRTKDGTVVNAVYGFALILLKIYKELKPDYLALTLDRAAPTFRHIEYTEYKAHRIKQPDELYAQIPLVRDLAGAFNIPTYELDGYEADDLIGTITAKTDGGVRNIIVTGDMDTLQLVDNDTEVFTMKKGVNDTVTYDSAAVVERYGLRPDQMIDYKALRGDASDNIPGVRGIGEKTAVELLQQFGTLENVYKEIKKLRNKEITSVRPRVAELLLEHEQDAQMSQHLATIVRDAPIKFMIEDAVVAGYDQQAVFDLFQKLEFKSLLSKIPGMEGRQRPESKEGQRGLFDNSKSQIQNNKSEINSKFQIRNGYHLLDDEKSFKKFIVELKKQKLIVIDTETTGLDTITDTLLGIGFCWKEGEGYYLEIKKLRNKEIEKAISRILSDEKVKKVGHNLKFDIEVLTNAGFTVRGVYFDTMLASYLLDPGSRAHDLDTLAFTELGYQMTPIEQLIGLGKSQITLADVAVEVVADYCCEDVDYTFRLYQKLSNAIEQRNSFGLMETIEMPLVAVLAKMELLGVKIDMKFLGQLDREIETTRQKLDKKIFAMAGKEFNLDSPLQLKEILFETLEIPTEGLKRGKTGFSTAAAELDKMRGLHPIIDLISEHRELAKLQSTYTQALPKLVNKKTGRVHTSFNQTVAATGRLSSSDPNLQNIPIRTSLGREVRKAFIAEKGCQILKADYSQIELRIVASLAQDKEMLAIFKRGEDIHAATAAAIHGVPLDSVTKEMRYSAKEVNFGVLYGMGAYGLSWRTGISMAEAKNFIDKYFKTFSGVKKFVDSTIKFARRDGYVETLFGRRRYLPEINSGMAQVKNAAERMAINAPIQGTAADLIKLAMIALDTKLAAEFTTEEVKMILQVHDELVFEVKSGLVKTVAPLVKDVMENVYQLRVPIVVDVEAGESWGETGEVSL
ncbi:DNA polymerase I [Candidatus Falkowbacteria bacterium]|nr:DNA polymerase I [Candidatus Falkowbacteria bacterium]